MNDRTEWKIGSGYIDPHAKKGQLALFRENGTGLHIHMPFNDANPAEPAQQKQLRERAIAQMESAIAWLRQQ